MEFGARAGHDNLRSTLSLSLQYTLYEVVVKRRGTQGRRTAFECMRLPIDDLGYYQSLFVVQSERGDNKRAGDAG